MILQYVTKATLDDLQLNFKSYKEHYVNQDKKWFNNYFKENNGLISCDKEFPDFQMNLDATGIDMSKKHPEYGLNEIENIKILYGALKDLPLSVAWDERFWTGLSHTVLWDYIWFRRKSEIQSGVDKDIKSSYLRIIAGRRGVFVNCVSRLWWAGYLTYDDSRENPYELTRLLAQKAFPSQMVLLSSRNFTSNRDIMHGILRALLDYEKLGYQVNRAAFETILTYLNNISAVTILDFLSEEEIYQISKERLEIYLAGLTEAELEKAKKKDNFIHQVLPKKKSLGEEIVLSVEKEKNKSKKPLYTGSFLVAEPRRKTSRYTSRKKGIKRTITLGKNK